MVFTENTSLGSSTSNMSLVSGPGKAGANTGPGKPQLAEDHPGFKFKWNESKNNGKTATNGHA